MQNQIQPRRRVCPHCGSWEIHSTQWKGLVERCVLYLWGLAPYQCKGCYKRFYARPAPKLATTTAKVSMYSSSGNVSLPGNGPKPVEGGAAFRAKA